MACQCRPAGKPSGPTLNPIIFRIPIPIPIPTPRPTIAPRPKPPRNMSASCLNSAGSARWCVSNMYRPSILRITGYVCAATSSSSEPHRPVGFALDICGSWNSAFGLHSTPQPPGTGGSAFPFRLALHAVCPPTNTSSADRGKQQTNPGCPALTLTLYEVIPAGQPKMLALARPFPADSRAVFLILRSMIWEPQHANYMT